MQRYSYDKRDYAYGQRMLALRTSIGLTQARLSEMLGVSRRAVAEWEAGSSYPKSDHLKAFIALAVRQRAFTMDHEAEEIRDLWKSAHQKVLLDEAWLTSLLDRQLLTEHASEPPPAIRTSDSSLTGTLPVSSGSAPLISPPVSSPTGALAITSSATSSMAPIAPAIHNLPAGVTNNLPVSMTSLIGREAELQAVRTLLARSDIRLLTMTGTGGIGKTRLALACAAAMAPTFRNGACLVELASLTRPDQVLPALIQALEVKGSRELLPLISLKRALCDRQLLLVLDNFEHVLPAAPALLELLQSCPDLKLLVTSRAILNVPGEYVFPVPSLAVPDLHLSENVDLRENASIALFMERAQARKPDFQLTAANASALVELCRRLDGLPLALELAAARVTHLSPQQLLARLTHSLDLLTSPGSAAPTRQQTMRQAIQWSYDLLIAQEQLLLCRLAVFIGGCTVTDVEALYSILGDDSSSVLDGIASLTEKSLVVQQGQDETELRLHLLEVIREYCHERLVASGEFEKTSRAHAQHYASFVPVPGLTQALIPSVQLGLVRRNYQNILTALHFFFQQLSLEQAIEMAVGMGGPWLANGYKIGDRQELERILRSYLSEAKSASPTLLAMAFTCAGRICLSSADFSQAEYWYTRSLPLWQVHPEKRFLAMALGGLGYAKFHLGLFTEGQALFERSITELRSLNAAQGTLARVLIGPGLLALHQGALQQAQHIGEEGVQLARVAGDEQWALGSMLHILCTVKYLQGDFLAAATFAQEGIPLLRSVGFFLPGLEALCTFACTTAACGDLAGAQTLFEEALHLALAEGDIAESGRAWCGLGYLAFYRHDLVKARQLFAKSFQIMQTIERSSMLYLHIQASSLEGLAAIDLVDESYVRAAQRLGCADALRHIEEFVDPLGREMALWEKTKAEVLRLLGTIAFDRAFAEGGRMTPVQAFAL